MKKRLAILGSTGVIGKHTLEIVDAFPENFEVSVLGAGRNLEILKSQIRKYNPKLVSCEREEDCQHLRQEFPKIECVAGDAGLETAAACSEADTVIAAVVGFKGMASTLAAIRAGKQVGLANKEAMITAGPLMVSALKKHAQAKLLPIDSEHNAVFQCLEGNPRENLRKIILTCSGGPFRTWTQEAIKCARVDQALKHPNWVMGSKITIDSASLMNKGLEMIEARFLFDLNPAQIDVVIHPQSVIHSMVEWIDGSVSASLGETTMRGPIAHVLSYPERLPHVLKPLNWAELKALTFEAPDPQRFPSLRFSRECLEKEGNAPVILNGANEIAVESFLKNRLSFGGIYETIEHVLNHMVWSRLHDVEDVIEFDRRAREVAQEFVNQR